MKRKSVAGCKFKKSCLRFFQILSACSAVSKAPKSSMKFLRIFCLPPALLGLFALTGFAADQPDPGQIEISVGRLLEQGHYSRKKLDEKISQQFLKNYLEGLDYNHLYFTQKDVDLFVAKFGSTLNNDVLLGNPEPAFT